jgi:hypothetical protein
LTAVECVRRPEWHVAWERPCPETDDVYERHCNSACMKGVGVSDAARQIQRRDQDIRAGSSRSAVRYAYSAVGIAALLADLECP